MDWRLTPTQSHRHRRSTEGICATLLGIVEPGDEVILLEPCYDSYPPLASLAQARIRYVSLNLPDFSLPKEILARTFSSKTKAIVINTPHNPCGKSVHAGRAQFYWVPMREIRRYAVGDEVYDTWFIVTPQARDPSCRAGAQAPSVSISSTAKTLSLTGWKQGFV